MSKQKIRREALVYHAKPQPGKIKIVPTNLTLLKEIWP